MRRRCASAWLLSGVALVGCQANETPVDLDAVQPPANWNAIPDGKPSGRIHGVDFQVDDARLYVRNQPGRQWVTISLSSASASEPCGPREPADAPSVWIRLPGAVDDALSVRELTRSARDADGWSVHYQLPQPGKPWLGRGRAAARFAIRRSVPGYGIDGDLAVCFADGMNSCVSGSFSARQCPDPVSPDIREIAP